MSSGRSKGRPPARAAATKISSLKEPGPTRRSAAAIQQERDEKAELEYLRGKERRRAQRKAAQQETASRDAAVFRKENPGSVYSEEVGVPKAPRKRPVNATPVDDEEQGQRKKIREEVYETIGGEDEEDEEEDVEMEDALDVRSRQFKALIEESDGSSDDFKPEGEQEDSESDSEVELEADETDMALERRRKKKKESVVKPGVELRQQISKKRDGNNVPDTPTPAPRKRLDKNKSNEGFDGLKSNYSKSKIAQLLPKAQQTSKKAKLADRDSEDDGPRRQYGGLVDDDEDDSVEHDALKKNRRATSKSIAKTIDHPESSKYVKKTKGRSSTSTDSSETSPKGNRALVKALPKRGQEIWPLLKALVINELARKEPWEDVEDEFLADTWNELVDDENLEVEATDTKAPLFAHVRKLIRGQVVPTEWRFKLAEAAVLAVEAEIKRRGLETAEEIKTFVLRLLGKKPRVRTDADKPFIYAATDSLDWAGEDPTKCGGGILRGRLVLKVLGKHLSIVGSVLNDNQIEKRPYGALCLSIQAVQRALEYTISGKMVIPATRDSSGFFSQDNWGDPTVEQEDADGQVHTIKQRRATLFLATMRAAPDSEWEKIINGAKALAGKGKEGRAGRRFNGLNVKVQEEVVFWDPSWGPSPSSKTGPTTTDQLEEGDAEAVAAEESKSDDT
ncbi:hypothetical protein NMY22_g17334 [Coprinellus aureogranulatus]|nr:hypothetical protein NMY22_g17334 [Coprinellus aureogranulatus]